jgi:hypothetical protein
MKGIVHESATRVRTFNEPRLFLAGTNKRVNEAEDVSRFRYSGSCCRGVNTRSLLASPAPRPTLRSRMELTLHPVAMRKMATGGTCRPSRAARVRRCAAAPCLAAVRAKDDTCNGCRKLTRTPLSRDRGAKSDCPYRGWKVH